MRVAVDKRAIIKRQADYGSEHHYLAEFILSHNKGFTLASGSEKFCTACESQGYKTPSFAWFQAYFVTIRNQITRNLIGESTYQNKAGNYSKIIPALNAGDQWQIDVCQLPLYCRLRNAKGG